MNIESGKFYKTKCGAKAKVIEVIATRSVAIGYILSQGGSVASHDWKADTGENRNNDYLMDLVSPWFDPPVVDWDRLPPGILAVAIDEEDNEVGFLTNDVVLKHGWIVGGEKDYGKAPRWIDLPRFTIKFSGSWRDSLVFRPGYEPYTQPFPPYNSNEPTPGPWRIGNGSCVVADALTGHDDPRTVESYGGHLICESATRGNLHLIASAWEMYEACKEALAFIRHYAPEEKTTSGRLHSAVCSAEGIPF